MPGSSPGQEPRRHTYRHDKTTTVTEHDPQDSAASLPDKNERVGGQAEEARWLKTSKNGWNL